MEAKGQGQIPLSLVLHFAVLRQGLPLNGELPDWLCWLDGQGASGILLSPPPRARILTQLQDAGPPAYLAKALPRAPSPAPWKRLKIELVNKQATN